ncbi:MAG TPA: hypothetical protein VF399_00810 [bacterium]
MSFQKHIKLCDLEILKDKQGSVFKDEHGNPKLMSGRFDFELNIVPNKNYDAKNYPAEYSLYVTCSYWNFVGVERCITDSVLRWDTQKPTKTKEED